MGRWQRRLTLIVVLLLFSVPCKAQVFEYTFATRYPWLMFQLKNDLINGHEEIGFRFERLDEPAIGLRAIRVGQTVHVYDVIEIAEAKDEPLPGYKIYIERVVYDFTDSTYTKSGLDERHLKLYTGHQSEIMERWRDRLKERGYLNE